MEMSTEPFDDHLGHSIDDAWPCELCTGSFVGDPFNGINGDLCIDCYEKSRPGIEAVLLDFYTKFNN